MSIKLGYSTQKREVYIGGGGELWLFVGPRQLRCCQSDARWKECNTECAIFGIDDTAEPGPMALCGSTPIGIIKDGPPDKKVEAAKDG